MNTTLMVQNYKRSSHYKTINKIGTCDKNKQKTLPRRLGVEVLMKYFVFFGYMI